MVAMMFLGILVATTLFMLSPTGDWGIAQIVLFFISIYVCGCAAILKVGLVKRIKVLRTLNGGESADATASHLSCVKRG